MAKAKQRTVLNVALLKRVRDRIARGRGKSQYDQRLWCEVEDNDSGGFACPISVHDYDMAVKEYPTCKTTACLAGWTVIEGRRALGAVNRRLSIKEAARRLLGISRADADYLFIDGWVDPRWGAPHMKRQALNYLDRCIAAKKIVRQAA